MKFHNSFLNSAMAVATLFVTFAGPASAQKYNRTDLTANRPGVSTIQVLPDANLQNAWGLARSSTSAWWVADNGTGLSTLYNGVGAPQQLVVTVPPPKDVNDTSAPTGIVFNPTTSFLVDVQNKKQAIFLFATEDGTISGWNPQVKPTEAIRLVNKPGKAVYKGLAIAQTANGPFLYATNFVTGRVEVFDGGFNQVHLGGFAFRNPHADDEHWSAFGIQNVGGNIVVTYARRNPGETDERQGPGLGRVAIFDTYGRFLADLQQGPWMNAPWGIALSPSDFGAFSHRLLIGNFGDGTIHAFNVISGRHEGQLLNADGSPLVIDGLWALGFGSGPTGQLNELFFTAGPNDEQDGLFGKIAVAAGQQRGNTE